jgi:hypothetical protein
MANSTNTYYGPVGETPSQLFLEKTFMAAGYLTGFGYGMQFILYIACIRILFKRARMQIANPSANIQRRNAYLLSAYITILCVLDTMWTGVSAFGLQSTFIDNRNYPAPDEDSPGGPIAYLNIEFQRPFNIVGQIVFTLGNILADAILLWRCQVIWGAPYNKVANFAMMLPMTMLLGSIVMGVMFGIETCSPTGLYGEKTVDFGVPYFTISLSLNIILTLMIVGKIWYHRRSMAALFGTDRSFLHYYKLLVMMFVESAALYSIIALLLLVTFALGHPINQIWLALAPATQKISNYLIIYRRGRACLEQQLC